MTRDLKEQIKEEFQLSDAEIMEKIASIKGFGLKSKLAILRAQLTPVEPITGFVVGHVFSRGRESLYILSEFSPFEDKVMRCDLRGYRGGVPKFGTKVCLNKYQLKNQIIVLNSNSKIDTIEGDYLHEIINLADYTSEVYHPGIYVIVGSISGVSLVRDPNDPEGTLPLFDPTNRQLNLKIRLKDEDGEIGFKIKKLSMLSKLLEMPEAEIVSTLREIESDLEAIDLLSLELLDKKVLAIGEGGRLINEGRSDETELSMPFLTFYRFGNVELLERE
ncbi:MAG TPA: hypothetical protein EYP30_09435 [Archaeoglobaceae archaeon]|nr:hypothetical protein [Archaeoglobaceae archaeon]